jgi:ligand-binding sensor domain-containing protein
VTTSDDVGGAIKHLRVESDGTVWVGTTSGLFEYDPSDDSFSESVNDENGCDSLVVDGDIALTAYDGRLRVVDLEKATVIATGDSMPDTWYGNNFLITPF